MNILNFVEIFLFFAFENHIETPILGFREIHHRGFTYLDLRPDNVLLTTKLNAMIADIGDMTPAGQHRIITPSFESPETEEVRPVYDVFTLGLIIVCFTLKVPDVSSDLIAPGNKRISFEKKLKFCRLHHVFNVSNRLVRIGSV